MQPEWDEVRRWLEKAQHDRAVSELSLKHDPPITDTAAFHAQQAAEKLLKAFLVFRGEPFEKVHDLGELIDQCSACGVDFGGLRERVSDLTPYAVRFRYPGPADPAVEQVGQAIQIVDQLRRFIAELLPKEITELDS